MDFFEVVHQRYSHKETFLSDPVPRAHLERIAQAGLAAPSGCNFQSVRLIAVDDPALLAELCGIAATNGLRTAPAAIAVMTDPKTQTYAINFEKEDYSAAVENMLLAAIALGYQSVWLDGILLDRATQLAYLQALGAPESYTLWAILPIGLPDGQGSRRSKLPEAERLSFNRFGTAD